MNKKKIQLIITIIISIIVIVGGNYFYNSQKNNVQVDNPQQDGNSELMQALDFNVQNEQGKNTYLSDFKDGKPIVLNFWSSQCGPCVAEMPDFQKLYDDYKDKVHFVFVDSIGALGETKEMGKSFIQTQGYTFPVYYDVNQNAQQTYSVYSFPTTYLINQNFELERGGAGMITYDILANVLDEVLQR